jgi:hypothetical protein
MTYSGCYQMNERQKAIVKAVEQFRALSRVHIERMFFQGTKNSKNNANATLNKLVSRGYLTANKNFQPYVYHAADSKLKKQGQKISQYLDIANTFLSMQQYGAIKCFEIEPRFNMGEVQVRPDLYCHWKGNLWAVECQNSRFTEKQMEEKVKRYEALFLSGSYTTLSFQQEDKKVMPLILIVGEGVPYRIYSQHIRIIQAKSIDEFMEQFTPKRKAVQQDQGGIKIKIG